MRISTKLLVIVITTAAFIAAATTTSLSAATPAFAKDNCTLTPEAFTCRGGVGKDPFPGGFGRRNVITAEGSFFAGGFGNGFSTEPETVGGGGGQQICDLTSCTERGGNGQHEKGPGGNSDNAPP